MGERVAVLGAGWPRTGTASLARALEMLGFGPCQHMTDVAADPELAARWHRAVTGRAPVATALAGWRSAVDWPTSAHVVDLARALPAARIVLTVRDPGSWWDSFAATVLDDAQPVSHDADDDLSPVVAAAARRCLAGRPWTPAGWQEAWTAHRAGVVAALGADRVLCWSVSEGWGPLCRYLGVRVPAVPFPSGNDTVSFRRRLLG